MWGIANLGVRCTICGFSAHGSCAEQIAAPSTCKLETLPAFLGLSTPEEEESALRMAELYSIEDIYDMHHWVEGNCHMATNCHFCKEAITSVGYESHRCSRCKIQVHTLCLLKSPDTNCTPKHQKLLLRKPNTYEPDSTPLLVFINSRSGGQQGQYLIRKFKRILNPNQIFDLNQRNPVEVLREFQQHQNPCVLCCGGDGTVGWVLSVLDEIEGFSPEVAILPLGTGNDLARTLNWGGGYEDEKLSPLLSDIENSHVKALDRWTISIIEEETGEKMVKKLLMNNYFSIGVDAEVALAFHNLRNEAPALCSSRLGNKFWYVVNGVKSMITQIPLIDQFIEVEVDGVPCELAANIGAIIVLNLPSYMGGANLWGTHKDEIFTPPAIDDGKLELVAVTGSFHLANVSINLSSAIRLAQGKQIKIKFIKPSTLSAQVDGEPWIQKPCEITIEHLNQAKMLCAPHDNLKEEITGYLDFEGTLF